MIINETKYPWLSKAFSERDLERQKETLKTQGAISFPEFLTPDAVERAVQELSPLEDKAYTTVTKHTAYLRDKDYENYPSDSIYNYETPTMVASNAYDELPEGSVLKKVYEDPRVLELVKRLTNHQELYLSADPLGCCSVNVFREGYYHGFHYDESEFSITLMLQEAKEGGLFQYTDPIRAQGDTLELERTADAFRAYEFDNLGQLQPPKDGKAFKGDPPSFAEHYKGSRIPKEIPQLHTLDFRPGTLLVLAGSKSLHRVTQVKGDRSRLVAVLTFSSQNGFCNTPKVQKMFWGRSSSSSS